MKRLFKAFIAICVLFTTITACDKEYTLYNGPEYIMFADTLNVLPIQNSDEIFDITIGSTVKCNYDRTMAVEIIDSKSNAIEGFHYTLLSNTVTIKAGENTANVQVRGNYENLDIYDSLGFYINLIAAENTKWDMYDCNETKVMLQKTKPFNINDFTGYALVQSTFLYQYGTSMNRVIKTELDPENENTVILKNYLYDGYDVKIEFDTTDVLNPLLKMEDQVMVSSGEAYGTVYGDGYLNIYQAPQYTSYYSTNETFIFQYMVVYVPGMAEGTNVVGLFANTVKWISEDEAKELIKEGY